ncbi:MAG: hypothetical protein ACC655_01750, partial [Rhodothermia bacterium]
MSPLRRFLFGGGCLVVIGLAGAFASANGPLASATLEIQGSALTIFRDAETNDAEQVVNVGERARVRTCYGGVAAS